MAHTAHVCGHTLFRYMALLVEKCADKVQRIETLTDRLRRIEDEHAAQANRLETSVLTSEDALNSTFANERQGLLKRIEDMSAREGVAQSRSDERVKAVETRSVFHAPNLAPKP